MNEEAMSQAGLTLSQLVIIETQPNDDGTFDLTVKADGEVVETFTDLSLDTPCLYCGNATGEDARLTVTADEVRFAHKHCEDEHAERLSNTIITGKP